LCTTCKVFASHACIFASHAYVFHLKMPNFMSGWGFQPPEGTKNIARPLSKRVQKAQKQSIIVSDKISHNWEFSSLLI